MGKLWPYLTPVAVAAGLLTLVSCQPIPEPTNSVDPRYALIRYLSSIHQLPGQHMTTTKAAPHTPGPWDFACDSYGKVQHSRKACVYAKVMGEGGERLINVAARINQWDDARLIAAAPEMLEALRALFEHCAMTHKHWGDGSNQREANDAIKAGLDAIAKAEGR